MGDLVEPENKKKLHRFIDRWVIYWKLKKKNYIELSTDG